MKYTKYCETNPCQEMPGFSKQEQHMPEFGFWGSGIYLENKSERRRKDS